MMQTYHKIPRLFQDFYKEDFTTPELEYLADNEWSFTEKVDGTNTRIKLLRVGDDVFATYGGRTNNAVITVRLLEYLEEMFPTFPTHRRSLQAPSHRARYEFVKNWMIDKDIDAVTLYGEGYGVSIHGGGKYRQDTSFVLFDVKIGDFWLSRDNVDDVASNLGIESVPTLGRGTLYDALDLVRDGLESQWGTFAAEGIVARPVLPLFDRGGRRIITKIRGMDFK